MFDALLDLDKAAFLAINGAHAPWADRLMTWTSDLRTWVPVYVVLLWALQKRFGWKGLAWSVPVIALMVVCTDSGSVLLFKNTVQRLRPCHDPEIADAVHLINNYCGGQFGFVSSHAANHFGIAVFMIGILQGIPRWSTPALLAWALVIGYSRIYLGVHFPGDVIVGGAYGCLLGWIFFRIFRRVMDRQHALA